MQVRKMFVSYWYYFCVYTYVRQYLQAGKVRSK